MKVRAFKASEICLTRIIGNEFKRRCFGKAKLIKIDGVIGQFQARFSICEIKAYPAPPS